MNTTSSFAIGRRQLKILLIRADRGLASDVRDGLIAAGHVVTEAEGGDDAARILRRRPVNLVLVDGGRGALALLEVTALLRCGTGRLSARYTPIFVLADGPSLSPPWPAYVDRVLASPLNNETLVAAYLDFLSGSLSGAKRGLDGAPCCEIDSAIDRLGGDVELYKDLVDRFLDDTAGTRRRLEAAIEHGDAATVHGAAHSLKGLAASVGATTVACALADLEDLGRAGDLSSISSAWLRFCTEMERTADELAPYHRSIAIS